MALKKDSKEKLKSILKGFDIDKLIAAIIATDEQDYELPAVEVLTADELITRDSNKFTEGEKAGEKKAIDIAKKELKTRLGIELKGDRWGDIGTELKGLMNKTESEQIKTLTEQNTLLLQDKQKLETSVTELTANNEKANFRSGLISLFPAKRTEGLSDAQRLLLLENEISFETVDGKVIAKRNGEVIKDPATHSPLDHKKVIENFFIENKWVGEAPQGGRGGGNSGAGTTGTGVAGTKKLSDFTAAWKTENAGLNEISPEFDAALQEHIKVNTDFDMNT